jgi:cytochrome c-type biogenesis protein CcmH
VLWLTFALMLAGAAAFLLWPLWRHERRLSAASAVVVLVLMVLAPALYQQIGRPDGGPPVEAQSSVDAMVTSLASRLQDDPDDVAGWKMLGRSYFEMRRLPEAIAAYERAVALESGADAQTLADLGEAVLMNDQSSITGRAGELFETALSLSPGNPKALFYAGLVAMNRGDRNLGADRWEALLATSPPENVAEVLRQRIAELRGESPVKADAVPADSTPTAAGTSGGPGSAIRVNIVLSDAAAAGVHQDATVFIIARDPAQPSPPLAAVRRKASELPAIVTLSDADAMIPGRVPSAFAELEIVARVSGSGQPVARSGDWFGQQSIKQGAADPVQIIIDQQVP